MGYESKNFEGLIGVNGFSEQLLKNHFILYQGYVVNTNKLIDSLSAMSREGKSGIPEYSELKRRFGWEFNGMRLHEYYFENITKNRTYITKDSRLYKMLSEQFRSYENWEKDFKASASMRGIGWVILYYEPAKKMIFNEWINEHDTGHLSGAIPILVMDVFEHAFMIDYGLKRAEYIEAFFMAINWAVVDNRFNEALKQ